MYGKRSTWTEHRELVAAGIWWMYEPVGDPLEKAVRSVIFINQTNVDIWFSTVPSTKLTNYDMIKCGPYSTSSWDITFQSALEDDPILLPVGTQFYARRFWLDTPANGTWVGVNCLTVESGS